jgi:hypothetical protein
MDTMNTDHVPNDESLDALDQERISDLIANRPIYAPEPAWHAAAE